MLIYETGNFNCMLTDLQRERLENRDKCDPKIRAYNDYGVAKKLTDQLKELEDIVFVLDHLPPSSLRRVVDDKAVETLFKITEQLLIVLGYRPIVTDEKGAKSVDVNILLYDDAGKPTEKLSAQRSANDIDEARAKLLQNHIDKLKRHLDPATVFYEDGSDPRYSKLLKVVLDDKFIQVFNRTKVDDA